MAIKLFVGALLVLCNPFSMQAATAAERIYCASSDAVVDMSLESGFSKKDDQKLIHFRGVAGIKGKMAPAELRRFQMNSEMIRQYWVDQTDLRFSLQADFPNRQPQYRLSISLLTARKSSGDLRFNGKYTMSLMRLQDQGATEGEAILDHSAPIFCAIKR